MGPECLLEVRVANIKCATVFVCRTFCNFPFRHYKHLKCEGRGVSYEKWFRISQMKTTSLKGVSFVILRIAR